jgi:uncharacterized integral membrane protein (TIGR00698 family)
VVAAGRAIGEQAAATAVITKMVRVMLLAPFLLGLSVYLSRESRPAAAISGAAGGVGGSRITIPWFALGFVAVTALNSLVTLPAQLTAVATSFDTFVLAMAMAALGLTTHVSAIRNAGIRPLALAGILFAWLIVGGVAINAGVTALLG